MNLKDAIRQEACSVFLNLNEFAEEMVINGVAMPALWDMSEQALGEASTSDPTGWGVGSLTSVLFVSEECLVCPLADEEITVKDERYTVIKAESQTGIIRLELERKTA